MKSQSEAVGSWGKWQRVSSYELRGGRIVPCEGAEVEDYQPWSGFRKGLSSTPPYQSLIDLGAGLRTLPSKEFELAPESEEALLEFARNWGALGLRQGEKVAKGESAQEVALAARTFYQAFDLLERGEDKAGRALLDEHLQGVAPVYATLASGKTVEVRTAPSLLGCFALMAISDLDHESKKLFRCDRPGCGRLMAGAHHLAVHCSTVCRNFVQNQGRKKRAIEERAKEAGWEKLGSARMPREKRSSSVPKRSAPAPRRRKGRKRA